MERRIKITSVEIPSIEASTNDSIKIVVCSFNSESNADSIKAKILKVEKDAFEKIFTLKNSKKIENIDFIRKVESSIYILVYRKAVGSIRDVYELFDELLISSFSQSGNFIKPSKAAKCRIAYAVESPKDLIDKEEISGYHFIIKKVKCYEQEDWTGKDQLRLELTPDNGSKKNFPTYKSYYNIGKGQTITFKGGDAIKVPFKEKITLKVWEIDDWDPNDKLGEKTFYTPVIGENVFKATEDDANYSIYYEIKEIIITKQVERGDFSFELSTGYAKPIFQPFFEKIEKTQTTLLNALKETVIVTTEVVSDETMVEKIHHEINPLNSEEKERINKFITEYYSEFLSNPDLQQRYIEELTHTQYPVMAYPVYPEPAYYYLKQFSERFILPASGSMPDNTMALFVNNPSFVESFLCGMNTEMGRELLWREYPTDTRGSYFRKFWDTEVKKDIGNEIANDTFFDILPIHKWEHPAATPPNVQYAHNKLGQNHMPGKDDLLIFAIKGELLKKYPETLIFLSKAGLQGNKILLEADSKKILPDLSAWLGEDTYIVGFPVKFEELVGNPATSDPGYFLTFMNRPGETRFGNEKTDFNKMEVDHAGETAAKLLAQPYIFGKHVSQFLEGWNNA